MYYLNILHFNNIKPAMNYCLLICFQQLCNLLSRRNSIMKNQLLLLLLARLGQIEHEAVYFYVSYSFCVLTSFFIIFKDKGKICCFFPAHLSWVQNMQSEAMYLLFFLYFGIQVFKENDTWNECQQPLFSKWLWFFQSLCSFFSHKYILKLIKAVFTLAN